MNKHFFADLIELVRLLPQIRELCQKNTAIQEQGKRVDTAKTWFIHALKSKRTGKYHLVVESNKGDSHECTPEGFDTDDEAFKDPASQNEASRIVGTNVSELKLAGRNTIIYEQT